MPAAPVTTKVTKTPKTTPSTTNSTKATLVKAPAKKGKMPPDGKVHLASVQAVLAHADPQTLRGIAEACARALDAGALSRPTVRDGAAKIGRAAGDQLQRRSA